MNHDIQKIRCYEGLDNYIFISYAHKDADRVYPTLKWLFDEGARIWFDKSIELGYDWTEELKTHIDNAKLLLFFASKISVQSKECMKEINRAIDKNKRIIIIYLDECTILGTKKDFSKEQGIMQFEFDSEAEFYDKFLASKEILHCMGLKPSDMIVRGPERKTFDKTDKISEPVFNSVINNEEYGDERSFVRIRALSENGNGPWKKAMGLREGCQYEIEIYIRNDACFESNSKENNNSGVALRTCVSVNKPDFISPNMLSRLGVKITSKNAIPSEISDYLELYSELSDVLLVRYVERSAKIHNNWKSNNSILPITLFTKPGAVIGLYKFDGIIPGGDAFISRISFVVQAEAVRTEVKTTLSTDGKEYYETVYEAVDMNGDDEIKCKIEINNSGSLRLENFTIRVQLPDSLALVPGSVEFMANDSGIADKLPDSLTKQGLNFGKIGTGNKLEITYKIKSNYECSEDDLECLTYFSYGGGETVRSNVIHIKHDNKTSSETPLGYERIIWGPDRKMFSMTRPSTYPVFNSVIDNPTIGDERTFVSIGRINDLTINDGKTMLNSHCEILPGNRYLVHIYFVNSISPSFTTENNISGVAKGVKIKSQFPKLIYPNEAYHIQGIVSAENTNPESVWATCNIFSSRKIELKYVKGSAMIYGDFDPKSVYPDELFSDDGFLIDHIVPDIDSHGVITYVLEAIESNI